MRKRGSRWFGQVLVPLAVATAAVPAAARPENWASELDAAIAAAGPAARREIIGQSVERRDLVVVRLTRAADAASKRPTLLVIAGLDARHTASSVLAARVLRRVAVDHAAALEHADLVVLACLNPDGMTRFETATPRMDQGGNAAARTLARDDADRDRRVDEDGPKDLNGDGQITTMRIRRPAPGLLRGLVATDITDPHDARLLRKADAGKGEIAEFAVLTEGLDQDGDGLIAEDDASGINLSANFPYHWAEFAGESGPVPLSEPETLALVQWLQSRPEIVAVLEFGPADNLINVPVAGKMDVTNEAPITGGVLDDDKWLFDRASQMYKDRTGITGTGGIGGPGDGSLQGWAYAQLGIAAFVTPGVVRSDLVKAPAAEPPASDGPTAPAKPPENKPEWSEDVRWIRESDARAAAGSAAGFMPWTAFKHPQLGDVELGGWMPGFKLSGTESQIEQAAETHAKVVAEMLKSLPRLEVGKPTVTAAGSGVWRVQVFARNVGSLPTRTAMGVRARRHAPTRWELMGDRAPLISGVLISGTASVLPGGDLAAEWLVRGEPGTTIKVRLVSPECGEQVLEIPLTPRDGVAPEANR